MLSNGKVPTSDDEAYDTAAVCERHGISRWTRNDWIKKHGFPDHDYYVGTRGYTWRSTLDAWVASRPRKKPAVSPNLQNQNEAEHAHQAA